LENRLWVDFALQTKPNDWSIQLGQSPKSIKLTISAIAARITGYWFSDPSSMAD
jgi:hypothetical protein